MEDRLEHNKEHARRNELKDMLEEDSAVAPMARSPLVIRQELNPSLPNPVVQEMHPTFVKVQEAGKILDLVAFADYILRREQCNTAVFFETPYGVIKLQAIALSEDPEKAAPDTLIFVVVDPERVSFIPKIGTPMRMSRKESSGFVNVICLSPPVKLTIGLGIDLMCFVRQASPMEKNGRVETDGHVVSVVSGRPATHVDKETGEPVADGEKPADIKKAAQHFEPRLMAGT